MYQITDRDKQVVAEYVYRVRQYTRNPSVTMTDMTASEVRSVSAVSQLTDFYEVTVADWVVAQFFWWHAWFGTFPPLDRIGSISHTGRKDSIWRVQEWRKDRSHLSMPLAPIRAKMHHSKVIRETSHQVLRHFDRCKKAGTDVCSLMMMTVPSTLKYLITGTVRESHPEYWEQFEAIREQYLNRYRKFSEIGVIRNVREPARGET